MKRILMAAAAGLVVLVGCGKGKGEQLADKVNEKIVAKINSGEIKTEMDLAFAQLGATFEAMKDLGIDENTKISESDKQKMEEKLKAYEAEWKKLLASKTKS